MFNKIAKKKANLNQEELKAIASFKETFSRDTIMDVLDVARKNGHPGDIKLSDDFENNYKQDTLTVEHIISFNAIYKNNLKYMENKDDEIE